MLDTKKIALATQCLWSLQEAAPEIQGLLFTQVDGLTFTSTLDGGESTQRLAAITTALFLLGEHISEACGSGEALEVAVQVSDQKHLNIRLQPVGTSGVLISLQQPNHRATLIEADLNMAVHYLENLLQGVLVPPPYQWNSS